MILEGIVTAALPQYGLYSVFAKKTAAGTGIAYMCTAPFSPEAAGTFVLQTPVAGQKVLFYIKDEDSLRGYIVCSGSMSALPERYNNPWTSYYSIEREAVSSFSDTTYTLKDMIPIYCDNPGSMYFAACVDDDIYQGDTEIRSVNGTAGMRVTDTMITIKGSALAFIDMSEYTNAIRIVGDTVARHTLVSENVAGPFYNVSNVAYSEREAFGCIDEDTAVFKEDPKIPYMIIRDDDMRDDKTGLLKSSRLPLFRMQHIEGPAVAGSESVVVAPKPDSAVHDESTEPVVLAKTRADINGGLAACSADGLISVKAPMIYAVCQTAYSDSKDDSNPVEDLRVETKAERDDEYREPDDDTKELMAQIRDMRKSDPDFAVDNASVMKILELLTSDAYVDKLIDMLHKRHLSISSDSTLKGIAGAENYSGLIGGGCKNDGYALPESFSLTDPVTGESKSYYCSSSFISQEPDGSILICDGYGSEIRMSRGHIYINPALDLRVRSGRDVNIMAGGHQAYVSNKSCTVSSTGDSMYITAAAAGKTLNVYGETVGIRGVKNVAVASSENASVSSCGNLLIGLSAEEGRSTGADKVATSGKIILDAGGLGSSSGLLVRAPSIQLEASSSLLAAVDDTATGSVMVMSSGGLQVHTGAVELAAGLVVDATGDNTGTFKVETVSGDTATVSVTAAVSTVAIKAGSSVALDTAGGSLVVGGGITAFGRLIAEQTADTVGQLGTIDKKSYNDSKSDYEDSIADVSVAAVKKLELLTAYAGEDEPVWSDLNLRVNAVPYAEEYAGMYSIVDVPATLWQYRAYNSDSSTGTSMWQVTAVEDVSAITAEDVEYYPYPGRSFWKDADLTGAGKDLRERKKMETDYIVNVTEENENE